MRGKHFPTFSRLGTSLISPAQWVANRPTAWGAFERRLIRVVLWALVVCSITRLGLGMVAIGINGMWGMWMATPGGYGYPAAPGSLLSTMMILSSAPLGGEPIGGFAAPIILAVSLTGLAVLNLREPTVMPLGPQAFDEVDPVAARTLLDQPRPPETNQASAPHPLDPRPDESEPGYSWGRQPR